MSRSRYKTVKPEHLRFSTVTVLHQIVFFTRGLYQIVRSVWVTTEDCGNQEKGMHSHAGAWERENTVLDTYLDDFIPRLRAAEGSRYQNYPREELTDISVEIIVQRNLS